MDIFLVDATFPPSLAHNPWLGAGVMAALLITVLLCLRWLYEGIDAKRQNPAPRASYIGVARRVRFWLVMAAFIAALPRLLQLMLWRLLDPVAREGMSTAAWASAIACAAIVIYAWVLDKRLVTVERDHPRRHGHVAIKPIPKYEKTKMLKVMLVVVSISLATTFVRPLPDADRQSTAVPHG